MVEEDKLSFYSYKYMKDSARFFLQQAENEKHINIKSYYITAVMQYYEEKETFNRENLPRPKWMEMMTLDMAKRFVEDSLAIEAKLLPGAVGRARREFKKYIKAGELLNR